MQKPELPPNEQSRLHTLQLLDILDTASEERFDRLTRMAIKMFDVPIALVSLIDEHRQWFKSNIGLNVNETPRDMSFCGHAILSDGVFVISDAVKDSRFIDNPLVMHPPYVRFYAGCPLVVKGHRLGTLCLIDHEPRTFPQEDIRLLKDLAATVELELNAMYMATVDELTEIPNRRGFMSLAQNSLNLCAQHKIHACLAFFDLNDFKKINDRFGHTAGDAALISFAHQMSSIFRESDVYARLGGDEFVVLLVNSKKCDAEDIVARFRKNIQRYNVESNSGYAVSFSAGIVEISPEHTHSIEDIMGAADDLMYKTKETA